MTDGSYNSTYATWSYNQSDSIWHYNMTDGSYNSTYAIWSYNQSDGVGGGNASWNQTYADDIYVNEAGDNMTGNLIMNDDSNISITQSGAGINFNEGFIRGDDAYSYGAMWTWDGLVFDAGGGNDGYYFVDEGDIMLDTNLDIIMGNYNEGANNHITSDLATSDSGIYWDGADLNIHATDDITKSDESVSYRA